MKQIILFIGSNRWEKEQALERLRHDLAVSETRRYDATDKALLWEDFFQSLCTFPSDSGPRLFILRQAEKCPARFQMAFLTVLQRLPKQNLVVLETDGVRLGGTFLESLEEKGEARLFQPPKHEELPVWIASRAKARGKKIAREACLELLSRGGEDLFFLDRAAEQLALYAGDREILTVDDVHRVIGLHLHRSGFELARAVGQRQATEALKLLSQLSPHETLPALVGSMAWHLRRLWQAKELLKQGLPREELSRRIGLRWEEREPFLKAASSVQAEEIDRILRRLLGLDVQSKSGFSQGSEGLELFILSLAQEGGESSGEA